MNTMADWGISICVKAAERAAGIPLRFTHAVRAPLPFMKDLPEYKREEDASAHYSLLWWNNADGSLKNVPRDAHWTWGLYDSLIIVMPSLDIVISRAGKSWDRTSEEHYAVLEPFLEPIVQAVKEN